MFNIFHKFIFICAVFFSKIEKKIKDKENSKNMIDLSSLSPVDKIDDMDYLKTLRWAIEEEGISNIALSGPYGSGKSSIIKAFEKEYKWVENYSFLNVSLATFKENDLLSNEEKKKNNKDDSNSKSSSLDKEDININEIEKSILQQMFYSVGDEDIPNSRFKRIKNIKWIKTKTAFLGIWVLSIIELFGSHNLLPNFPFTDFEMKNIFQVTFILGLLTLLYYFIKGSGTIKLQKLSLQAPEIDFSSNSSSSILNEHIDEIIYFFEVTDYNILVIEDLDRFDNPDIFIKLREINILLNNSKQINRNIVFIYAIRDNMFINKERTKFFDFIVPVIPVINFSNSYTKLKEKFNRANILTEIDDTFLKEISLYIDDMRFLQNVFNEYIQYKNRLNNEIKLDNTKLFAMIIYKNWKPLDFANLHVNEGIIYRAFNKESINEKIKLIIDKKRNEIKPLKKKIQILSEEKFQDINTLKSFYMMEWIKKLTDFSDFYIENNWVALHTILNDDDVFNKLINLSSIRYRTIRDQWGPDNVTFRDIENQIDAKNTYNDRIKLIENKLDNKEQDLIEEVNLIEKSIQDINNMTIKELIDNYSKELVLEKELLDDEVLSYMIRYEYIDQYYAKYISYFYDGDETIADNNFLLNLLKDEKPLAFNLKLSQVDRLMKRFRVNDYNKKAILNYSLLNHLIKLGIENHEEKILNILFQMYNSQKKVDFILDYIVEYRDTAKDFINLCISFKKDFWDDFGKDSTNEQKDNLLEILITICDINELHKINQKGALTHYIDISCDVLSLARKVNNHELLIELFISLEVKLNNIGQLINNEAFFELIYKNNLYKLNLKNVIFLLYKNKRQKFEKINKDFNSKDLTDILVKDLDKTLQKDFANTNYTLIQESKLPELIAYVDNNISDYINSVFLKLEKTNEKEEVIISFLNNEELSDKQKIKILKHSTVKIDDLTMLEEKMIKNTFIYEKFVNNWNNIIKIYALDDSDILSSLADYFNELNVCIELSQNSLLESFDFEVITGLIKFIGEINLDFKNYKLLMEVLKGYAEAYDEICVEDFGIKKIEYLLENNLLALSEINFRELERCSPELSYKILENNPNEVEEFFKEYINEDKYFKFIIENHKFDYSTHMSLIYYYVFSDNKIDFDGLAKSIYDIVINNEPEHNSKNLYLKLIRSKSLIVGEKLALFDWYDQLELQLIDDTVESLGTPYSWLQYASGGYDLFENNESNKRFLKKLYEINYISSYTEDKKNNRIRANKYKTRKPLKI